MPVAAGVQRGRVRAHAILSCRWRHGRAPCCGLANLAPFFCASADDHSYVEQKLLLGTHTSEDEDNHLLLAKVCLPADEGDAPMDTGDGKQGAPARPPARERNDLLALRVLCVPQPPPRAPCRAVLLCCRGLLSLLQRGTLVKRTEPERTYAVPTDLS